MIFYANFFSHQYFCFFTQKFLFFFTPKLLLFTPIFQKYDNNSFLSGYVHQIVYDIFECDFDDEIIISHLLDDCQVIEKFSDAWSKNTENEKEGKARKGYMGHLYNILKLLMHLSELHNDDDEEHSQNQMTRNKVRRFLLRKWKIANKVRISDNFSPQNFRIFSRRRRFFRRLQNSVQNLTP